MKKLYFLQKKTTNTFYSLLLFCLCFNFASSQTNLVLNGTCENHTIDVNDNADAFDMTPPSTVDVVASVGVASPYRYDATNNPNGWNNSDLDDWLNTNCGNSNEQPGSTSDGNKFGPNAGLGRGVKISSTCRRLYQVVPVTIGTTYTFSIDSRSEAMNVPSTVYILNTEIADETGLSSTIGGVVDGYKLINNDFNATKSSDTENTFTTSTITFTATTTKAVIYVKAPAAIDSDTEVFYDNIKLYDPATASVKDVLASKLNIYPNPAKDYITVESKSVKISSVAMYNLLGAQVISEKALVNSRLNVSGLAKGIYMLKVNAEGASTTKKIVIE